MTKIEWTEKTWNPIVGCSVVSPGCTNCYAMKRAARIERMGGAPQYDGTTQQTKGGAVFTGHVALAEKALLEPLKRNKPTTYFVNSMGDLVHENVPDEWINQVFAVMALCPQHTFQVLTKRSARMQKYMARAEHSVMDLVCKLAIDWVIVGGESGRGARPMHPDWARSIRDQCADAGVPFFFKQWGNWKTYIDRDNDDPDWLQRYPETGSFKILNFAGGCGFHGEQFHLMQHVGKKAAGRTLDGKTHDGMPT